MIKSDYVEFSKIWKNVSESQAGKPVEEKVISFVFDLLADIDLEEVKNAVVIHCRQSEWMPRPAEIIAIVLGALPSAETLFVMAGENQTIIGRYVRSLIGGDALTLTPKQGAHRVLSKQNMIDDFYSRALTGGYTDDELKMLLVSKIDLFQPIAPNCPRTRIPFRAALSARAASIVLPAELDHMPSDRTEDESASGKEHLAKLMLTLKGNPPAQSYSKATHSQRKEKALRDVATMKRDGVAS